MGFSAFYGSAQKTTLESATAVVARAVQCQNQDILEMPDSRARAAEIANADTRESWGPEPRLCRMWISRHTTGAVASGVKLLNSANFYGPLNVDGYGANLRLLKPIVETIGREKVELMVKICMDTRAPVDQTGSQWINAGDAATVRADVAYALETLGVSYLDVAVLCRVPDDTPIEETVRAMQALVGRPARALTKPLRERDRDART